jgi:Sensors of blue-light using FAD
MADTAAGGSSGQVFRLIYWSRNRIAPDNQKVALGKLFSQARSNNKQRHITGALLVFGDFFAQVLEGDEAQVRALYETIAADARHDHVTLIYTQQNVDRAFSRWAMARMSEHGEPDIPLIAHTDGISPAAGHKITPQQELVLDLMHEALRDARVT